MSQPDYAVHVFYNFMVAQDGHSSTMITWYFLVVFPATSWVP